MTTDNIAVKNEPNLVFAAYIRTPAGRPKPPGIITNDRPRSYFGYFENENGEKWVFEFDLTERKGRLLGEDCSWREYEVIDGKASGVSLDQDEANWLRTCWRAATTNLSVTATSG